MVCELRTLYHCFYVVLAFCFSASLHPCITSPMWSWFSCISASLHRYGIGSSASVHHCTDVVLVLLYQCITAPLLASWHHGKLHTKSCPATFNRNLLDLISSGVASFRCGCSPHLPGFLSYTILDTNDGVASTAPSPLKLTASKFLASTTSEMAILPLQGLIRISLQNLT